MKSGTLMWGTRTRWPLLVTESLAGLPQLRLGKQRSAEGEAARGSHVPRAAASELCPRSPGPAAGRGTGQPVPYRGRERRRGPGRGQHRPAGRQLRPGGAGRPLGGGAGGTRALGGLPSRSRGVAAGSGPGPAEVLSAAGQVRGCGGRGCPPGRAGGRALCLRCRGALGLVPQRDPAGSAALPSPR